MTFIGKQRLAIGLFAIGTVLAAVSTTVPLPLQFSYGLACVAIGMAIVAALLLLIQHRRMILSLLCRNLAAVGQAFLASVVIATALMLANGAWHTGAFVMVTGLAFATCFPYTLSRSGQKRRYLLSHRSTRSHLLKDLQRSRTAAGGAILLTGLSAAAVAIWLNAPDAWLMGIMGGMILALLLAYWALSAVQRRPAQLRTELLDEWFPRCPTDHLPQRELMQLVDLIQQPRLPSTGWAVGAGTSVLFFEYAFIPDALAVAISPVRGRAGSGVVVSLPHPLQRDPVDSSVLHEAFRLPSQRGEFCALLADHDCYQSAAIPAVVRHLDCGREGELWGWVKHHVFCLWLGPLERHEVGELAERCSTLASVLSGEAGSENPRHRE